MRTSYIVLIIFALSFTAIAATDAYSAQCVFAEPAGIGSGPVSEIRNLTGQNFDWAYMKTMYQQNADIMALADYGSQEACSRPIRILSNKIISERMDMNEDLNSWYGTFVNRVMQSPSLERYAELKQTLSGCKGPDFDCSYTSAMICLMQQSQDAAELAIEKTSIPQIYRQARVVSRTNANEIQALKNWQCTGLLK